MKTKTDVEPTPEAKVEEQRDLVLLYLGVRVDHKGKKFHAYAELESAEATLPETFDLTDERWFSKPLSKHATPGSVWSHKGTGTSVTLNGRYLGRYGDGDKVQLWQAQDRATQQEINLATKQARELRERVDYTALEPIRKAYWAAMPLQRALILANAVQYIVKGKAP